MVFLVILLSARQSAGLPSHPTEDGPSVTSSQPSLKAAVDRDGDIKVTPDEGEHLSSSFRPLAAEFFFSSLLSSSFFFYFISTALSPLRPLSVFSQDVSVHQREDHHSGSIDLLRRACTTRNRRLGGSRRREGGRRGGE